MQPRLTRLRNRLALWTAQQDKMLAALWMLRAYSPTLPLRTNLLMLWTVVKAQTGTALTSLLNRL